MPAMQPQCASFDQTKLYGCNAAAVRLHTWPSQPSQQTRSSALRFAATERTCLAEQLHHQTNSVDQQPHLITPTLEHILLLAALHTTPRKQQQDVAGEACTVTLRQQCFSAATAQLSTRATNLRTAQVFNRCGHTPASPQPLCHVAPLHIAAARHTCSLQKQIQSQPMYVQGVLCGSANTNQ
jgi:hypothetical protein